MNRGDRAHQAGGLVGQARMVQHHGPDQQRRRRLMK
jgi:hypothetical protein